MNIYIISRRNKIATIIYSGRIKYRLFKDSKEVKYDHDQAIYTLNYRGWTTLLNGDLIIKVDIDLKTLPKTISLMNREDISSLINNYRRDKIIKNILK